MRRHVLGILGLTFLALGLYMLWSPPGSEGWEFFQGPGIKVGIVFLATWLAYPQLERLSGWSIATVLGIGLLIAVQRNLLLALVRVAILLIPLGIIIWLLRVVGKRQSMAGNRRPLPPRRRS